MANKTKENPYFWSGTSLMMSNNNGTFSSTHIFCADRIMPTKEQQELIRDAFNVTNDTGLSPLELKEQNDMLVEASGELVNQKDELQEQNEKMRKALKNSITQIHELTDYGIGANDTNYAELQEEALTPSKGQK